MPRNQTTNSSNVYLNLHQQHVGHDLKLEEKIEQNLRTILSSELPELSSDSINQIIFFTNEQLAHQKDDDIIKSLTPKFRGLAPWQERRAKGIIESRLNIGISVNQLASECSFSRSHFSRAFKLSTGITPHQYLLNLRIDKAKNLLSIQNLKIIDISTECGFSDSSHFTKVFSKLVGYTPSYWRRMTTGFMQN
ncbi:helix-turn-helix transcriptional regulator [Pseudomonas arsenicoxydans]|nr:helix-turn-helix transcriptional regulator [Pseudomonas arsenicoxydans]